MVVSRAEGAPWPGQRTPVLSGDLDANGWAAAMAAKGPAAARQSGAGSQRTDPMG